MKPGHWTRIVASFVLPLAGTSIAYCQGLVGKFYGANPGDQFGTSVASAGDVNGDGVIDIIVGAPEDTSSGASTGMARVFSGKDGSVIATHYGSSSPSAFGTVVDGTGDIDLDGYADYLITSPGWNVYAGTIEIYSGGTSALFQSLTTGTGFGASPNLGFSAAGVGDIDQDGVPDVLGGAPAASVNGTFTFFGAAIVFAGGTGTILQSVTGNPLSPAPYGEQFGFAVAGTGDVNGDGRPDWIASSVEFDNERGYATVVSGATGSTLFTFNGDSWNDLFGDSLAGAGDVNGDGRADIVVGAPFDDNSFANAGSIRVFSGANGAILYTRNGVAAADKFGASVAGLGDIDGDGKADVIAGAPLGNIGAVDAGYARIFNGATGAVLSTLNGAAKGDHFGSAVKSAADVNGDGRPDFAIGAPLAEPPGTTAADHGMASVFSFVCGSTAKYGTACAGAGGFAPVLDIAGCATPGGTLDFSIAKANGGGIAVALVSASSGSSALGGACALLVGPAVLAIPVPLLGIGPGAGTIQFPATIPIPSALGTVYVQAFCQDPALFIGFTATNGVALTVN